MDAEGVPKQARSARDPFVAPGERRLTGLWPLPYVTRLIGAALDARV